MSAKNVTSCLYVIFDTIIRFTTNFSREEGNSTKKRVHSGINRDLASRAHGKVFSKGKLSLDRYWRGRNGADSKSLPFRHVLRDSSASGLPIKGSERILEAQEPL
ncbi:hypothetical protein B0H16DRAFT_1448284 [Mycena metata]|uniref:Uncharacterized protein n=1 Tax=Mycena metata TaxID=1033252 RepID=A0AAD7NY62_9AGAR|nr:hypothetical protein B0H16DRAFT_1448284 [Mycena metata]